MNPHIPSHGRPSGDAHDPSRVEAGGAGNIPDALCDDDCEALEALCAAEFDCSRVPTDMRERARRMLRVLGLLEHCAGGDVSAQPGGALVDATCAQVARARRRGEPELSPRDEDALEALICSGLNPAKCPSPLRGRATHQHAVLSLLDVRMDAVSRETLVTSTLSHVQRHADSQQDRMTIQPGRRAVFSRLRMQDMISVAALILVCFGVLTPMLNAMRGYAQQSACSSNMSAAGLGFSQYAQENKDALPMATPSLAGRPWWFVGQPDQSNSANAYTVIRTGHVKPEQLACAGNPHAARENISPNAADWQSLDQVSYSYQNMFAQPAERPKWTSPVIRVVLADRSPLIPKSIAGERIHPLDNSLNHMGKGQTVLFNDGAAQFLKTPVLKNGDNIWLPRAIEQYLASRQYPNQADPLRGTETPVGADDVFLGP